eukprot:g49062.t1
MSGLSGRPQKKQKTSDVSAWSPSSSSSTTASSELSSSSSSPLSSPSPSPSSSSSSSPSSSSSCSSSSSERSAALEKDHILDNNNFRSGPSERTIEQAFNCEGRSTRPTNLFNAACSQSTSSPSLSVPSSSSSISSSSSSSSSSSLFDNLHETKEERKRRLRREYQRRRRQNPAVREAESATRRRRINEQKVAMQQNQAGETENALQIDEQKRVQKIKKEEKNARNQHRREIYQESKDNKNEERRASYPENKDSQNEERQIAYCSDPGLQEVKNARRRARQTGRNILYKIGCSHISSFDENGNMPLAQHEDDKLGTPFDSPNQRCPFCGAWFWKHELNPNLRANQQFTDRMAASHYWSCCANGYVKLDRLPPLPTDLLNLFILDGPVERYFRQHILSGPPTFVIQGSTHHLIGPLQPNVPDLTNFLQIYFLDNNQRRARRLHVVGLPDNQQDGYIFEVLEEVMRNNRFLQAFETALDRARLRRMLGLPPVPHFRLLCLGPNDGPPLPDGSHRGQFNVPGDDSIAILINEDGTCVENAHRIVDERQITINASHADYDPLVYVLFCPSGTGLGFHTRINYNNQDNRPFRRGFISCLNYYRYRIYFRDENKLYPGHESYVHIEDPERRSGSITDILYLGRSLWQQFLVDQYCKIQDRRLDFERNNPIVSERYMNAMSIVRLLGRPSLFITMTAKFNPNWQEIQDALKPGQTPNDRPDIVQRVFEMKVKQLIKAITKDNCFGRCMGFVYSVENQKRGLPHIHLVIWLHPEDAPLRFSTVSCQQKSPTSKLSLNCIV